MPVRAGSDTLPAPPLKRKRINDNHYHLAPAHPIGVKPSGNALFAQSIRSTSLGLLDALSDEELVYIFSLLEPKDWARIQAVSHACRAFALHESHWKEAVVVKTGGHLKSWNRSWRRTYIEHFYPNTTSVDKTLPPIRVKGLFSDALFLPLQLACTPLEQYIPSEKPGKRLARLMDRVKASTLGREGFLKQYLSLGKPCLIIEDAAQNQLPSWTLKDLADLYGTRRIRAEALTMPMSCYVDYARSCQEDNNGWIPDESPFYLFDPTLAKTMQKQGSFVVPAVLTKEGGSDHGVMRRDWDLFSLLQEQRPDHAWIIAGPGRSGSGWHVDPNSTSAFNTVLSGRKLWMLLPPNATPPGVFISSDGSSVTAPLSIIEWLINFWNDCIRFHGRKGDDTLLIDVCSAGETIFVPAGWKHLVINLEESVAFTQNFAGTAELPMVLDMFKNRPEQISGFRLGKVKAGNGENGKEGEQEEEESDVELDELENDGIQEKKALFQLFVDRLRQFDSKLVEEGLRGMYSLEQKKKQQASALASVSIAKERQKAGDASSLWTSLKNEASSMKYDSGFSFDLGDDYDEETIL